MMARNMIARNMIARNMIARNMMARNIDIGKEKLYISTNQDGQRACRFTPLFSRQKYSKIGEKKIIKSLQVAIDYQAKKGGKT